MKTKRRLLIMAKKDNDSDRLKIDKTTRSKYNEILERSGPLNKKNKKFTKDIFILALAFGYENNINIPLENKDSLIRSENFGADLQSLVNALSVTESEEGVEILSKSPSDRYVFSEEYANAGLDLLYSEYMGHEDEFIEKLRLKIIELNENDKILKKLEELNL